MLFPSGLMSQREASPELPNLPFTSTPMSGSKISDEANCEPATSMRGSNRSDPMSGRATRSVPAGATRGAARP